MAIRHFYHVYAGGGWAEAVAEHAEALGDAGFPGPVTVGMVGNETDRGHCRERILSRFARAGAPAPDQWIEADTGYEQVTLARLRDWALTARPYDAALYCHTKGAHSNSPLNPDWRRSMTRHVVGQWVKCLILVTSSWDTAGCHWLTPERDHEPPNFLVNSPFYGGNFWWARAGYLRTLSEPGTQYRHQAEEWIGLGNPKAADLLRGWPSVKLCR